MAASVDDEGLAGQDWEQIGKRLTLFAHRRLWSIGVDDVALAQDLAQEAISRLFDPNYAGWDQARQPVLLEFLGSVVNGLISNLRKKRRRRGAHLPLEGPGRPHLACECAGAETRVSQADELTRIWALLQQELQGDPLAVQVLELTIEGCERPRHQAAALGVDVERIYQARRRLRRCIEGARAALRHDEEPATGGEA